MQLCTRRRQHARMHAAGARRKLTVDYSLTRFATYIAVAWRRGRCRGWKSSRQNVPMHSINPVYERSWWIGQKWRAYLFLILFDVYASSFLILHPCLYLLSFPGMYSCYNLAQILKRFIAIYVTYSVSRSLENERRIINGLLTKRRPSVIYRNA